MNEEKLADLLQGWLMVVSILNIAFVGFGWMIYSSVGSIGMWLSGGAVIILSTMGTIAGSVILWIRNKQEEEK